MIGEFNSSVQNFQTSSHWLAGDHCYCLLAQKKEGSCQEGCHINNGVATRKLFKYMRLAGYKRKDMWTEKTKLSDTDPFVYKYFYIFYFLLLLTKNFKKLFKF